MTQRPDRWTFEAFGTNWAVETDQPLSSVAKQAVMERLSRFDETYSRFRDDSLVMKMGRQPGTYTFPSDFPGLYAFYADLYELTGGKMTPLIGRQLEQAGYDKTYSLQPGKLTDVPALMDAITWDGERTVTSRQPMTFDVGAAGKGYAVDLIAPIIEKEASAYVIDASGDIRHRGRTGERIGLEHPNDPSRIIGVAALKNRSLCASAVNRRAWQGVHHIIDPLAKKPVEDVVATWVISDTTLQADGLATALFFVDSLYDLVERYRFEFVRMFQNGSVDYSPGFEGELFI
ncbi:FAD:protein FMN transferase [Streptomyces caniscabiei]|uniref:FAD:protein FMN transferase n=1 Tax=Streptomyces caniscabiei TaxID=2746961 RepID=UPI0029BA79E1|nr:FAD:protein FMN transferase [Streptomyces caniscabiei]MDX2775752.1 FAD:protein FMN transferase [Streptomyces caniscabiei]